MAGEDEGYRVWIKSLPCLICQKQQTEQTSHTEGHHAGQNHGLRQKPHDRTLLPLCGVEHHREGPESVQKLGKRFEEVHGIDIDAEIQRLNREYPGPPWEQTLSMSDKLRAMREQTFHDRS